MSGVLLGGVALQGFEVPEEISFGGRQTLATHRLPGGGLVVDALGAEAADIVWSGAMIGPDASDRARRLDGLRESGAAVALLFGDMAFDVVVREFAAAYRQANWIGRYRIRCLVLPGEPPVEESGAEALASALASALGLDPSGVVAGAAAAIGAVVSGGSLAGAFGVVSGAYGTSETAMDGFAAAAANGGTLGGTVGLAAASGQAELLAKSGAMTGLLGGVDMEDV